MEDKKLTAEKESSLTDLAERNSQYTADLERHTIARNYLWRVATNEEPMPVLTIGPGWPCASGDKQQGAEIDMAKLPTDVIEALLLMTIDHEEKAAASAWEHLARNANLACSLIEKMRKQRDEHARREAQRLNLPQEDDEFPHVSSLDVRDE